MFADFGGAGTPMTGWLRTSDRGLGKVGEWFERFVVPRQDDMVRAKPIGPFADRIVVYVLKRPDEDEVAVVFDVVEGKPVAQARLTLGGVDLVPLRLDDTHFVLPVEHPNPGCGVHDGVPDTCAVRLSVTVSIFGSMLQLQRT